MALSHRHLPILAALFAASCVPTEPCDQAVRWQLTACGIQESQNIQAICASGAGREIAQALCESRFGKGESSAADRATCSVYFGDSALATVATNYARRTRDQARACYHHVKAIFAEHLGTTKPVVDQILAGYALYADQFPRWADRNPTTLQAALGLERVKVSALNDTQIDAELRRPGRVIVWDRNSGCSVSHSAGHIGIVPNPPLSRLIRVVDSRVLDFDPACAISAAKRNRLHVFQSLSPALDAEPSVPAGGETDQSGTAPVTPAPPTTPDVSTPSEPSSDDGTEYLPFTIRAGNGVTDDAAEGSASRLLIPVGGGRVIDCTPAVTGITTTENSVTPPLAPVAETIHGILGKPCTDDGAYIWSRYSEHKAYRCQAWGETLACGCSRANVPTIAEYQTTPTICYTADGVARPCNQL